MKKTMFFVSSLDDGGAQRVISILASRMVQKGMDVEIVTYLDAPVLYPIHSEVKITCVQKETEKKSLISNLLWLRSYFKENAEIVLSFLAPFNMIALVATMGLRVPIVVADRNDPAKVPGNKVIRIARDILYVFADQVVVQTEANKAYFKVLSKKTTVIYNPVDLKEYTGLALKSEKDKIIVSAGRLMPQKNQKMLIDAFSAIMKKFPEYQLVIYGEGNYREELESYVKALKLEERIFMPGSVTDLYDKMKSAELFVLSSDYEGMPNALIEAMCMGLACVSTKVSGATDLIQDHKNGLLTEVDCQEEFEGAILELIENPEFVEKFAKLSVELNEQLELSKIMEQWIAFINKIIAEK